jgi:hypothetical protein
MLMAARVEEATPPEQHRRRRLGLDPAFGLGRKPQGTTRADGNAGFAERSRCATLPQLARVTTRV